MKYEGMMYLRNIENKKYRYINFILIAIYCFIFIKSLIDGRFIEYNGYKDFFDTKNFIVAVICFVVFSALLSLIAFAFHKLKLIIPYIIFAILYSVLVLALVFSNDSGGWISFKWYTFLEPCIGALIFVCFPVIFVISLLIKWFFKKFKNQE